MSNPYTTVTVSLDEYGGDPAPVPAARVQWFEFDGHPGKPLVTVDFGHAGRVCVSATDPALMRRLAAACIEAAELGEQMAAEYEQAEQDALAGAAEAEGAAHGQAQYDAGWF